MKDSTDVAEPDGDAGLEEHAVGYWVDSPEARLAVFADLKAFGDQALERRFVWLQGVVVFDVQPCNVVIQVQDPGALGVVIEVVPDA